VLCSWWRRRNMNVAIVVQNDYPHVGEVRSRKLAISLREAGHHVFFVSWNCRQRAEVEDLEYARVYRFGYFLTSRFYYWLGLPFPLNPFWVFWILRVAKKERPDIIIASNIRIALPAILAARLLRRPIVLDLQENNEELVRLRPKTCLAHTITRSGLLVGMLERLCARLSDHVWVVIDERLERLPARLRKNGKVSVVRHTAGLQELQRGGQRPRKENEEFTLMYLGIFHEGVGPMELILRSLPYVLERDKRVRLLIGGVGPGHPQLEALVETLGLQGRVVLAGVIDPGDVPAWLQQGDVGLICYDVNALTNSTVSNKLFHYMAAGLPVLSTAMAPTMRIIEEVRCGAIIPAGSSHRDVAEIILRLKNIPEERAAMAERGKQAIREKYNWDVDFREVLRCLEKVLAKNGNGFGHQILGRP